MEDTVIPGGLDSWGPHDEARRGREIQIVPVEDSFSIDTEFMSEDGGGAETVRLKGDATADVSGTSDGSARAISAPALSTTGPALEAGATLLLADLLENDVAMDWREAVAIAQRVCRQVSHHPAAGVKACLLDPRHVAITERGDVRVLPGPPGSDPLVKQVGRILRALLDGADAPVRLRLIASQAAFEVPGFATVEELSQALSAFEAGAETDTIRTAFLRGREAKYSASAVHQLPPPRVTPASAASIASEAAPRVNLARTRTPAAPPRYPLAHWGLVAAVSMGVLGAWFHRQEAASPPPPTIVRTAPEQTPGAEPIQIVPAVVAPGDRGANRDEAPQAASRQAVPEAAPQPVDTPAARLAPRPRAAASAATAPRTAARAADTRVPIASREAPRALEPGVSGVSAPPAMEPLDLPDEPIERARVLLRHGRTGDAQLVLDAVVLANPWFELDAGSATLGLRAALQASRRALLPAIALKALANARSALASGEYDRAIAHALDASRLLSLNGAEQPRLREAVQQLLDIAHTERARDEQRIYSRADADVIPPEGLGRQLPAAPPAGVSRELVGTLEIVVSREGEVETVTLHTPLNRFHERMIVSAAKAWRYRAALRNGRPVRFRLVTSINLPEE